jgi:hypothetical protein
MHLSAGLFLPFTDAEYDAAWEADKSFGWLAFIYLFFLLYR